MKNVAFFQKMKSQSPAGWLIVAFCCINHLLTAQCDPDLTPPEITCPADISTTAAIGACSVPVILPDASASDACGAVTVTNDGGIFFPLGNSVVVYTATDLALNTATCVINVWVAGGIPDYVVCRTTPYKIADADGSTTILPDDVILGSPSYGCGTVELSIGENGTRQAILEIAGLGDFEIYCWISRPNGSIISCSTTLSLLETAPGTSIFHFPAWRHPWDNSTDSLTIQSIGMEFWESFYDEIHFTEFCSGQELKTIRNYTMIDWMDGGSNPTFVNALDLDMDGLIGDGFDAQIFGDSLFLLVNGVKDRAIAPKAGFYEYRQLMRYPYPNPPVNIVGTVYEDENLDCSFTGGEPEKAGWVVKVIGHPSGFIFLDTTDINGHYEVGICLADTSAEISLDVPFNYSGSCPPVYEIAAPPSGQTATQDIAVQLQQNCERLSIDLSAGDIRPCNTGSYTIAYCNVSSEMVTDAQVELALDNYLALSSSSMPATPLGGNAYKFSVGDLPSGFCGDILVNFTTDCNTPVGAAHCSEAKIAPVSACSQGVVWTGPWLDATAVCDGDSVRLTLKNIGLEAMPQPLEFVVVEDLIMYMSAPFQLDPNETKEIAVKADGATYHIQSPQAPGHPFGGIVAAGIEGCGGLNLPGASLVLPVASRNPFSATDCQAGAPDAEAIYMTAIPTGFGPKHLIEPNTDLEYTIHFQNPGPDTAANVEILLPLDAALSAGSVIPGAGSHPFDYDVWAGAMLRFRFDGINLPDSASNVKASQGFVSFRVQQNPDLPVGTVIANKAQIGFGYHLPVWTNTVQHEIGKDFISVDTDEPWAGLGALEVYPNPGSGTIFFKWETALQGAHFTLRNSLGRRVLERELSGNSFQLDVSGLASGVYFYEIGQGGYTGRVVIR